MNSVFVVFAKDKDNPFSSRRVVAVADDVLTARMIIAQKKDTLSRLTYIIQEWDLTVTPDSTGTTSLYYDDKKVASNKEDDAE